MRVKSNKVLKKIYTIEQLLDEVGVIISNLANYMCCSTKPSFDLMNDIQISLTNLQRNFILAKRNFSKNSYELNNSNGANDNLTEALYSAKTLEILINKYVIITTNNKTELIKQKELIMDIRSRIEKIC